MIKNITDKIETVTYLNYKGERYVLTEIYKGWCFIKHEITGYETAVPESYFIDNLFN